MSSWLPPDQVPTAKFPVVGERAPAKMDDWRLTVGGLVPERSFTWAEVLAWPDSELLMDVHCVTRWSRKDTRFVGTPLSWLLDQVGEAGRFVRFVAYSARDHDTSLPLDFARDHCWLIHSVDGAPLSVEHGGPLRVVTQGRYFYKSLKWLKRIELLAEDRLGYWERTDGYHNVGDPWAGDQRYVSGSLTDKEIARFLSATDYTRWRTRTIQGVDLRTWRPSTSEIGAIRLKNCDLREVDLSGADLRGANFSLSDLTRANLRGAKLRGADLEGAFLVGADLRDADLRDTFLTATSFDGAQVAGADFTGASGILESQERWLAPARSTRKE